MRHLRHSHTLAIVALVALSISLLSTISPTDAWPLQEGALQNAQLARDAAIGAVQPLHKRQATKPAPGKTTTDDEPEKPTTTPTTKPAQTTEPATTPHTTTVAPKPTTTTTVRITTTEVKSAATSSRSGSSTATNTNAAPGNGDAQPTGTPSGPSNGEEVPTKVSQKVLIGIGTVGGMIVFALGGLAFCRHRRKKNLAKALLQQTAQFHNNNPYAKISEPNAPVKESLPMTPTKPLGSCHAVSAYIPNLADEIEIGNGDTLTILQEFDDGWCFGANNSRNGIQGVFPRYVFERHGGNDNSQAGPGYYPPDNDFKPMTNKRQSSIPMGGGWNNGPPNSGPPQSHNGPPVSHNGPPGSHNGGGYGNYPSNPNQYQGQGYYNNNNQGGY